MAVLTKPSSAATHWSRLAPSGKVEPVELWKERALGQLSVTVGPG